MPCGPPNVLGGPSRAGYPLDTHAGPILKNEDAFNAFVAEVFARLLDEFPVETRMSLDTMYPGAERETIELYCATIEFLDREGFIHARRISHTAPWFANVVLSLRGLTLLRTVPDSVADRTTWGDRVKAAAKFGGVPIS
jgi:hypothetical protein